MNLLEFYPTPIHLVAKMASGIDFNMINTVLEPSAGKGNICEEVNRKMRYAHNKYSDSDYRGDIDCIEIDGDLRGILKNKDYRVVHDDFLTYSSRKKYDLIIMNPPFSDGDKHLMKAIEMQETFGGGVVCLLNAETLRNPHTNLRATLNRRLEELGAEIEYLEGEFESAERTTSVEVALIKVVLPERDDSLILDGLRKARQRVQEDFEPQSVATHGDFIQLLVEQYNFEINAGINLITEYKRICPYISKELKKDEPYSSTPILELKIDGSSRNSAELVNGYIEKVRVKYWKLLFQNPGFVRSLTSNLQNELYSRVGELSEYEFSYHNIKEMQIEINRKTIQSVEDTIIKLFDDLSRKHSYYDESSSNIHYYNGWKTNKAHKINKKVIIPLYAFNEWRDNAFDSRKAIGKLDDIEKCLAFLDGGETLHRNLHHELEKAERIQHTKNIELKYFKVTFFKKGTCHLTFTNERLLEKFNIFGCQRKGWLPPSYGKKRKADMTAEERATVDSFGGDYNAVMSDTNYYIIESGQMLLGGASMNKM